MARKPTYTEFEKRYAEYVMVSDARARELARAFMYCVARHLFAGSRVSIRGYGSFGLYVTQSRRLNVIQKGGGRRLMQTKRRVSVKFYPARAVRDVLAGIDIGQIGLGYGPRIDIAETKVKKELLSVEK